jgi:choline dehydrogenase
MLAVRGDPVRYDEWSTRGAPQMRYENALRYFRKLEACSFSSNPSRATDGPIAISTSDPGLLGRAFIAACAGIGLPPISDYNSDFGIGTAPFQSSIANGLRSSAATGYLRPAQRRKNLTVITGAVTQRVLLSGSRATGVEYTVGDKTTRAEAAREVMLCAGAIRSPQLLELSGIGAARVLSRVGIPVLHELPGVGENLQDHYMVRIGYRCNKPITIYDFLHSRRRQLAEALQYIVRRKGLLAGGSLMALAFAKSSFRGAGADMRLQIGLSSGTQRASKGVESGLDPFSAFHLGGYFLYPQSRGSLHVKSVNARDSPEIHANYLVHSTDRTAVLEILGLLREIGNQPALKRFVVDEIRPGSTCQSTKALLQYAVNTGDTCWHPIGTCKMGDDDYSVVDQSFQVRGMQSLRVVDASIFPFHTSSNTNIPTIMIAEMAADLIRS